jgi:pyruvate, water dikinase
MTQVNAQLSTGLAGLDRVLRGLIPGDNIVCQVDSVEDYRPFIAPYCAAARERGFKLTYFRFAKHAPLVEAGPGVEVLALQPEAGFERFVSAIHKTIERNGHGGFYIFDCLSDLAVEWNSDQMLGNFFMVTCPYLFDVEAIAYFGLLRTRHSVSATGAIAETAQVLLNTYRHHGQLYIHPLKVQQRHSPTMYMLHAWHGEDFQTVTESATICEVLNAATWVHREASWRKLGVWEGAFFEAEDLLEARAAGRPDVPREESLKEQLLRMAVSRDPRVLDLARRYIGLADVVEIGRRMIGTGLIGGKSVGMLLGRAILRHADAKWSKILEPHDSFFIGSDVFYTFLVRNGIWWMREKQRDARLYLEGAERARQRMLVGAFPEPILEQFQSMLDYFGPSPIIVRSSSLLEDNFGNAFAGKYESVFCANQGPRQKRMDDFVSAVKTIYASTMSEKALSYRARRGMLDRDEQMALLVQRVSGAMYGDLFYPQIAGVGLSYNPYVWSEHIDPRAGVLRLVFGLGTRAVNRSDDDYTRVVSLNAPARRVESNLDEVCRHAQRKVDVLDLEANQLVSCDFAGVVRQSPSVPIELYAQRARELDQWSEESRGVGGAEATPWVLTFDKLFTETQFVADMRDLLSTLEKAYAYPVDVEFTGNFFREQGCKINLLQCRPLQVQEGGTISEAPTNLAPAEVLFECRGAVIGHSRSMEVDRIVFVLPEVYGRMSESDRYAVARLIGRITHLRDAYKGGRGGTSLVMGPGRWGTTIPSLGIPVSYGDIDTVSVLCEIVAMHEHLVPDVSLGTHFFNEVVEQDMLYLALFPGRDGNCLNHELLTSLPNQLPIMLPEASKWASAVRVIDAPAGRCLRLHANVLRQRSVCYLAEK